MHKQISETNEQPSQRRIGHASAYSARVQEAMRYDKLPSSDYSLVMTILNAVLQGYSEERWKEEQQRTVKALTISLQTREHPMRTPPTATSKPLAA